MDHEVRNPAIYRERKAGKSFTELGKQFDLTKDRVAQICDQERFREEEPELAAKCTGTNFAPAVWLWKRGFKIIPPD